MSKIKSLKPVGKLQTYDLEVDHPDHQYYLSNGVLTSNSHSTLYSMISFHTAYLKAHFPLEFLVANLKSETKKTSNPKAKDNVLKIKDEIRSLGIKLIAPNVNNSLRVYKIITDKTLMTGLNSIKYVSDDAIEDIVAKRPFKSYSDFIARTDSRKVRANSIQALAASGCLDDFGLPRKLMFLYASDFRKKQSSALRAAKKAGNDELVKQITEDFEYPWPEDSEWSVQELFALEEYFMGEGLSGTVQERYVGFFDSSSIDYRLLPKMFPYRLLDEDDKVNRKKNTHPIPNSKVPYLKGIIKRLFSFKVKKDDSPIRGQEMAIITIQDPYGTDMTCIAFPDTWVHIQKRIYEDLSGRSAKLDVGLAVAMTGSFQHENEHVHSFIIDDILDIQESPALPKDRDSKSIKLPRKKKVKEDPEKLEKEELAEIMEDDMIQEGFVFDEPEPL